MDVVHYCVALCGCSTGCVAHFEEILDTVVCGAPLAPPVCAFSFLPQRSVADRCCTFALVGPPCLDLAVGCKPSQEKLNHDASENLASELENDSLKKCLVHGFNGCSFTNPPVRQVFSCLAIMKVAELKREEEGTKPWIVKTNPWLPGTTMTGTVTNCRELMIVEVN